MLKIFVINLRRDAEKLAFMDEQLRRLELPYTRIPGVYGKDLSGNQRAAQVNAFRWWCAIGRPVVPAEIGVALSHASIYGKIPVGEAACVFEDDVLIDEAFPVRLTEVENRLDATKPQVYLFSDHQKRFSGTGIQKKTDGICADGYVITKPAADFVLKENFPMKVPCDHWFRWAKQGKIELYHVLPATVRQNQARFGTSTQANAVDVASYPLPKWCWHKFKRLIGKSIDIVLLRIGL